MILKILFNSVLYEFFFVLSLLVMISCCADCSHIYSDSIFQETQIEFAYSTGRFISIDKNYAEIGLFAPLFLSNCYSSFLDARGYCFKDGKWAASTGIGIRKNLSEFSAFGINAYYDYRRGESKHNFHQIGLGFEWLNNCWDIRINGYLPISQKTRTSESCVFDQLGDGFFARRRRLEFAYSGFEAEIGSPLGCYSDFNLYGTAGPYYFFCSHQNHFFGGHGRLELSWKSILSFQVRISYDKVYSTNVQGIIHISLPLDFFCSGLCQDDGGCHYLINQQVRRKGIILTDHCCDWMWNWDDLN